jgi:DNA invertase Pin-like site-specific DNA recombinase
LTHLSLVGGVPAVAQKEEWRAIESWAARESVEITSWQVDVGVDGATPIAERPALLAAYQAIREWRAGMLVAANVAQFSHDELVCWLIERAALTQGATVHTADGSRIAPPTHVSATEEPTSFTRGAVDLGRAFERVAHRARVRDALAEKKMRGERIGTIPYGRRLSADGRHLELDDAEQAVIAMVVSLAGEGLSQRAIAARLEERGVLGRTGAPLRQTQVANILRAAG